MFRILKLIFISLFLIVAALGVYAGWLIVSPFTPAKVQSHTQQRCKLGVYAYQLNKPGSVAKNFPPASYCPCFAKNLVQTFGPEQSALMGEAVRRLFIAGAKERLTKTKDRSMRNAPDMLLVERHMPALKSLSRSCGGA